MASLANCLKMHARVFSEYEQREVRRAAAAYRNDGLNAKQAEASAVEDVLNELDTETEAIEKQVAAYLESKGVKLPSKEEIETEAEVQAAAEQFVDKVAMDPEAAIRWYEQHPDTKGGMILNADIAKEYSEDFVKDKAKFAQAAHEPASWMIKEMYKRRVQAPAVGDNTVVFLAGGGGSGKSAAAKLLQTDDAHMVVDAVLGNKAKAKQKIELALKSGKRANIIFVARQPVDSIVHGVVGRMIGETNPRAVPVGVALKSHKAARDTVAALAKEYKNNPNVKIEIIDNTGGKEDAKLATMELLNDLKYENAEQRIKDEVVKGIANGSIKAEWLPGLFPEEYASILGQGQEMRRKLEAGDREGGAAPGEPRQPTEGVVAGPGWVDKNTRENGAIISPPVGGAQFSIHTVKQREYALKKYLASHDVSAQQIDLVLKDEKEMLLLKELLRENIEEMPKAAVKEGGPVRSNADDLYNVSLDFASMCVKRLGYGANLAELAKRLGRSPKIDESLLLTIRMSEAGHQAPCLYCYVESPRRLFMQEVDRYAQAAGGRFELLNKNNKTYKKDVAFFKAAMKRGFSYDDFDYRYLIDPEYAQGEESAHVKEFQDVYKLINSRAASSSAQNKVKTYQDYIADILTLSDRTGQEWKDEGVIDYLNRRGGFRMFSTSDFQIEHAMDLIQAVQDLFLVGMQAHAYTKVPDFVESFGATGIKINMSVFGVETTNPDGTFAINEHTQMGMPWNEARRLRDKFEKKGGNVGTIFVTTSDNMTHWAKQQPWIDFIIPFHASGMPKEYFTEDLNWTNYSGTQNEKVLDRNKPKGAKIVGHEILNRNKKGQRLGTPDKQLAQNYVKLLKERNLKGVFPQFQNIHEQKMVNGKMVWTDTGKLDPAYAKFKKDYSRTDTPFNPPDPNKINLKRIIALSKEWLGRKDKKATAEMSIIDRVMKDLEAGVTGHKALRESALRNRMAQLSKVKTKNLAATSANTAIYRDKAPAPNSWLAEQGLIRGSVFHQGSGRDTFSKQLWLDSGADSVEEHDPNYYPNAEALEGKYDTVVSPYVLNTLPEEYRADAINDIKKTLKPDGIAYIALRTKSSVESAKTKTEFEDGWLIRKAGEQNFQKGYTDELVYEDLAPHFTNIEIIRRTGSDLVVKASGVRGAQKSIGVAAGKSTKDGILKSLSEKLHPKGVKSLIDAGKVRVVQTQDELMAILGLAPAQYSYVGPQAAGFDAIPQPFSYRGDKKARAEIDDSKAKMKITKKELVAKQKEIAKQVLKGLGWRKSGDVWVYGMSKALKDIGVMDIELRQVGGESWAFYAMREDGTGRQVDGLTRKTLKEAKEYGTKRIAEQIAELPLQQDMKLGDVLDHPELYKAYPEIKEVSYLFFPGLQARGALEEKTGAIVQGVAGVDIENFIHETQHWIQVKEGFARGTSADFYKEKIIETVGSKPTSEAAWYALGEVAHGMYLRTFGEVEARDSAARVRLTEDQRRGIPPYYSEKDLPVGKELILFSEGDTIHGAYLDGTAYIVADNVDSKDAYGVLLHELGVHYSFDRGIFGKGAPLGTEKGRKVLNRFKQLRTEGKTDEAQAVQEAYRKVPDDVAAVKTDEEALAYFMQDSRNSELTLFQQVVAAVKAWAFNLGLNPKHLTSKDIAFMIDRAVRREAVPTKAQALVNEFAQNPAMSFSEATKKIQGLNAFKRWFAGSKVVDARGRPRVMYHGTIAVKIDGTVTDPLFNVEVANFVPADFEKFYTDMDGGAHFGTLDQASARLHQMTFGNEGQRIMPVYLQIKNPLRVLDKGSFLPHNITRQLIEQGIMTEKERDALRTEVGLESSQKQTAALQRILKEKGYDGFVYLNRSEAVPQGLPMDDLLLSDADFKKKYPAVVDSYAVFDPEQVKSVYNQGTWDPNNPNISMSQQPIWRSQMVQYLRDNLPGSGAPKQFFQTIKSWAKKGQIKNEELQWSGLEEWLATQKDKVTLEDVLDYLAENNIRLEEKVFGTVETSQEDQWERVEEELNSDGYSTFSDQYGELYDVTLKKSGDYVVKSKTHPYKGENEFGMFSTLRENYKYITMGIEEASKQPKYAEQVLPGGEKYREIILQLPLKQERDEKGLLMPDSTAYRGGHFETEFNILVHVRFNERTDVDGKRVLFLEEVQSDWHQAGRKKGYTDKKLNELKAKHDKLRREINTFIKSRDDIEAHHILTAPGRRMAEKRPEVPEEIIKKAQALEDLSAEIGLDGWKERGIPDAPFKKTWPALAMRRMIRWAAENGYDRVAWTTGKQQADRYDLSKRLSAIEYRTSGEFEGGNEVAITGIDHNFDTVLAQETTFADLDKWVGKEIADKIKNGEGAKVEAPTDVKRLSGLDLKVGGQGMVGFYDKILPAATNKFIKKWGSKVGQVDIQIPIPEDGDFYSLMNKEDKKEYSRLINEKLTLMGERPTDAIRERLKVVIARLQALNLKYERTATHGFDITPEMKQSAMAGMPLFSKTTTRPTHELYEQIEGVQENIHKRQQLIEQYIRAKIDPDERGKVMAQIKEQAIWKLKKTQRAHFETAIGLIDQKAAEFAARKQQKADLAEIGKLLKGSREKKGRGKMTPEIQTLVNEIGSIVKMTKKAVQAELKLLQQKTVLPDTTEGADTQTEINPADEQRITLLMLYGKGATPEQTADGVNNLRDIVTTGKMSAVIKAEALAEYHKGLAETAEKEFGGADTKRSIQLRKMREQTLKGKLLKSLNDFAFKHQRFYWLLDSLSRYDKDTEPGKGKTTMWGGNLTHGASQDYTAQVTQLTQEKADVLMELYGTSKWGLFKAMRDNVEIKDNTGVMKYAEDGTTEEIPLSQNQAYKLWQWLYAGYNGDERLRENLEKNGWNRETMGQLEGYMKPEVKQWAEWQMNVYYPKIYNIVNPVFKELYNVSMPQNVFYTPIAREYMMGKEDDPLLNFTANHGSVRNGSLEQRVTTDLDVRLVDGDQMMDQHMVQMIHFVNWGVPMRELRAVLGSKRVRAAITQNHGTFAKSVVDNFLDDMARGGVDRAKIIKSLDRLRVAFTTYAVGANPVIMLKQLTSVPAYAMDVPLDQFAAGLTDFAKNPKQAVKTLLNTKYIKNRYTAGWERDIKLAMESANPYGVKSILNWLMLPTKLGDAFAIMVGGWGVYKYNYDKAIAEGKTKEAAEKIADFEFGRVSDLTQQSAQIPNLAYVQRLGSLGKLFTMFMTTPISYYQQWEVGARNLIHGRGSKAENIKRMAIAQFVLPIIFTFVAGAFKWDWDDQKRAMVMGPAVGLFIARDVLGVMLDGLFLGEFFGSGAAPPVTDTPILIGRAAVKANKMITGEGNDLEDFMKELGMITSIAGRLTGVPIDPAKRMVSGWIDPDATWRQKIGYSKYRAEAGDSVDQAKQRAKKVKAVKKRVNELTKARKWVKLSEYRKNNRRYLALAEHTKLYDKTQLAIKKRLETAEGAARKRLIERRKLAADRYLKRTERAF